MGDLIMSGLLDLYTLGVPLVFRTEVLLMLVIGSIGGVAIGALPGLTATMAVAVMTPLTYGMSTESAFALLLGAYCAGVYGGCITAVVAKIPGTPSSIMTMLDGYPMGQRGEAGKAIGIATVSSVIGGFISVLILALFAPVIANFALDFSAQEYFAIALFGLSVIAYISHGSMVKGLLSGCLGLLLATIGCDPMDGYGRYTLGSFNLLSGLELLPLLIGMFGIAEVLCTAEQRMGQVAVMRQIGRVVPTWKEMKALLPTIARGSTIGVGIGALPAAGGTIAAIIAYGVEKRVSRHPERFGHGVPEGVASAESANNATTGGAMIPMLTLGIPGDAITAILIGALLIHGLQPGPMLFSNNMPVVSSIFIMMALANLLFLGIGLLGARLVSRVVATPMRVLLPIIMLLCIIGVYAVRNSVFDLWMLALFGLIGYLFNKGGIPTASFVLGFILGPLVESNLRRSLTLSEGDLTTFFTRPICAGFLVLTFAIMVLPYVKSLLRKKKIP